MNIRLPLLEDFHKLVYDSKQPPKHSMFHIYQDRLHLISRDLHLQANLQW